MFFGSPLSVFDVQQGVGRSDHDGSEVAVVQIHAGNEENPDATGFLIEEAEARALAQAILEVLGEE